MIGALAVVAWALAPTYPAYDASYHLVWGRELLHGALPSFEVPGAPTEHPLYLALGALLALAGPGANRLLVLVGVLSLVALLAGLYRLGSVLFNRWAGVVAAVLVGSSPVFLLDAALAYVDIPFLALVVWAGALAAARPSRPWTVMVLLGLAGLLRPEGWLLAAIWWLACWGRSRAPARAGLAAVAAAAPVLWGACDLAVTGDALFSAHATGRLAHQLGGSGGAGAVPGTYARFLADTIRAPVAVLGVVGLALALKRLGPRRVAVPAVLLAVGTLAFLASGLADVTLLPRYAALPSLALCVVAGYALCGFVDLPKGAAGRRAWRTGTQIAVVAGLAFVVLRGPAPGRLLDELRFLRTTHRELAVLLGRPVVRRGLTCGRLTFPTSRLVPDARWLLRLRADRVAVRRRPSRPPGVALYVVGGRRAVRRYGLAAGIDPRTDTTPPGVRPSARSGPFRAFVRCPARR